MSSFARLRSKLYRIRRLSLEWMRAGGDPQEIVDSLLHFHKLLEKHRIRAGERTLDRLILRLQEGPSAASSDHASAA
jgi:hypothetical protein